MKSLKTLVLAKSIAAAIVASAGIAAPAISHASPDDGMVCRVASGYNAQFVNGTMKCTKVSTRIVPLDCPNVTFTLKQRRSKAGSSDGRDVCTRPTGLTIPFDSSLASLVENQDYVFPKFSLSRLASIREVTEKSQEFTLGLVADQVDASSTHGITTGPLTVDVGTGAEDGVSATITVFTFPIAAANFTLQPILPVTPNLPSPRLP